MRITHHPTHNRFIAAWLLIVCLCGSGQALLAQTQPVMGVMGGWVTDEHGGALEHVVVTLENASTGFRETLVTDTEGRFLGVLLPLGLYIIEAELEGFQSWSWSSIELLEGQTIDFEVTLKLSNGNG